MRSKQTTDDREFETRGNHSVDLVHEVSKHAPNEFFGLKFKFEL